MQRASGSGALLPRRVEPARLAHHLMKMPLKFAPLLSLALYLPACAVVVWLLRGQDFSLTADKLAGLALISAVLVIGYRYFGGRYVQPRWKLWGKAFAALVITYFAMVWLGPWGVLLPLAHQAAGFAGHVVICRRHGINWRTCEPRADYIALQERYARGDFLTRSR